MAARQHHDTALVGETVSRGRFMYRTDEPPKLYSRVNDPKELHNLADVAEHDEVRAMETSVLRFMMESSDFLPYQKDPRSPEVKLKDPKSQRERRGALAGGCE